MPTSSTTGSLLALRRLSLLSALLAVGVIACDGCAARGTGPTPSPGAPKVASAGSPTATPAAPATPAGSAGTTSADAAPPSRPTTSGPVRYVGAIDDLAVHADLTVDAAHVDGRLYYEKHGAPSGTRLLTLSREKNGMVALREQSDAGIRTGDAWLHPDGPTLQGMWTRPGARSGRAFTLTREERSRVDDDVVRARRIFILHTTPKKESVVSFLPEIDGPSASRVQPNFTMKALFDEDERDLGDGVTYVDFQVLLHDARLVTIRVGEQTMGAYPSFASRTVTVAWANGARVDATALRPDRRAELVALLDARVRDAWSAKKAELAHGPTSETSCGPDVVSTFMSGPRPSFDAKALDTIYATPTGIAFAFDIDLPHVAQACSPEVAMDVAWPAASRFLAADGPLGPYATSH